MKKSKVIRKVTPKVTSTVVPVSIPKKTIVKKTIDKAKQIYIQIASYRDPELLPTILDCLANAEHPERLVFGVAWQHNPEDAWDTLGKFGSDPRFKIIDINYKDSLGVCNARNKLNGMWDGEGYTLQLDSHHRFAKHWDSECIGMIRSLQKNGYKKPLLTAYIPSYDPTNDPLGRANEPWELTFDRFIPEGAIFMLPQTMRDWKTRTSPLMGRYLSAHFIFTLGQFCKDVPYNPEYYFHGEEISMAVRAFTHGYDIFYPHKIVAWHEYTRKGRTKQWDDDTDWVSKNNKCHDLNRKLFGMDGNTRESQSIYGFGTERSLEDYERYAGISFTLRAMQQETLDNKTPPNPVYTNEDEYKASYLRIFKHCIDVAFDAVPYTDYDFWCVVLKDKNDVDMYRQDATPDEILRMRQDPDGYCKIWRTFFTDELPAKWVVWPHSIEHGWCDQITGTI